MFYWTDNILQNILHILQNTVSPAEHYYGSE